MTITSFIFRRQLQSLHRTMSTSTTFSANRIRVEMVSDAICPFCYIGYKNYDAGVSLAKKSNLNLDFDLEFKPFLLDPTLGSEPVNKRERYAAKFGGKERVAGMEKQMVERGKDVGINFSYGGTLSRTHDYHRVMAHAYKKGGEPLQRKLAETFFTGYFENEQDPGQRPYLVKTTVETGIFASEDEANQFFDSSAYDKEVNDGYRQAKELGISGVPFFIFKNQYAVSGAQPPEAFLEVFKRLSKENKTDGAKPEQVADGGACEVGKECAA